MPTFNSSAIRRAEYNDQSKILQIWFVTSGGPYDYYQVPRHVYDGLLGASSKGSYFAQHIKDRYGTR